jgi:hypothetical protein
VWLLWAQAVAAAHVVDQAVLPVGWVGKIVFL